MRGRRDPNRVRLLVGEVEEEVVLGLGLAAVASCTAGTSCRSG